MKNSLDETFKEGVLLDQFLNSAEKDFVNSSKVDKEGIFLRTLCLFKKPVESEKNKENGDEMFQMVTF